MLRVAQPDLTPESAFDIHEFVTINIPKEITGCRRFFGEPSSPRQRPYEALRAFYLEGLPSVAAAKRFGYAPGTFRVLCYAFRRDELPEFFTAGNPGPRRKRNYAIYEISQALKEQGTPLSATAVGEVPAAEGFARWPRRRDDERPARVGPTTEAVADVLGLSRITREKHSTASSDSPSHTLMATGEDEERHVEVDLEADRGRQPRPSSG